MEKTYQVHSGILPGNYRKDIDGLRAIAILSVILFHFGCLANGYLGVDIFFVISGYLITKIIFNETLENHFSITGFYLRRIRRIIPLVLFTTSIALIVGMFTMIPDDLENLSQSVVSTNLFANNILLYITTGNYWNVINDFKPLMHTWSLGIEEQYYLFYPFIFLIFKTKRIKWILPVLIFFTIISILLFITNTVEASNFYLIPYRFYELSLGGIGSVYLSKLRINSKIKLTLVAILIFILAFNIGIPDKIKLTLTLVITLCVLLSESIPKSTIAFVLENKLMIGIGKISFSLYMWHQIVLAFTRYFILETISTSQYFIIFLIIVLLSIFSYYFIEQPFRNKKIIKNKLLLWSVCIVFLLTMSLSLYIYFKAGVIRDVPELGIVKTSGERNMHTKYNSRIFNLDREFSDNKKNKVLVIGDSFARDWANVLMESLFKNKIEISYISEIEKYKNYKRRFKKAEYIFISATIIDKSNFQMLVNFYNLDSTNIRIIGTKNFGINNGIFYNKRHDQNYFKQRTFMAPGYMEENQSMKIKWGKMYIDLIEKVVDRNGMVRIFTPDNKFISEDCRHLTRFGAIYYSQLLKHDLITIFEKRVGNNNGY